MQSLQRETERDVNCRNDEKSKYSNCYAARERDMGRLLAHNVCKNIEIYLDTKVKGK